MADTSCAPTYGVSFLLVGNLMQEPLGGSSITVNHESQVSKKGPIRESDRPLLSSKLFGPGRTYQKSEGLRLT